MQTPLTVLIIQHMQVDMLEDNRPMHGQEGIPMINPEIRSLSVKEEKTPFGIDLVEFQHDLVGGLRFVGVDICGVVLGFQHGS